MDAPEVRDDKPPYWPFTRDGHVLSVRIEDAGWRAHLTCPGKPSCAAMVDHEGHPTECNLLLHFEDAGSEFLEWQKKTDKGAWPDSSLPVEIEWVFEGWDDSAELYWRPVAYDDAAQIEALARVLWAWNGEHGGPRAPFEALVAATHDGLRELARRIRELPCQ